MFKAVNVFSSFAVKDLKKAKDFYSKSLGLKVAEEKQMGLLNLELGKGNRVMVYPKPDHKPANYTMLNLVVKNIDQAVADLTKRGVKFEKYKGFGQEPNGIARGGPGRGPDIAWLKDPSGNIVAVLEDSK